MDSLRTFLGYYLAAGMLLWVANGVWAFRDARRRGRSGLLIALLVLGSFPLGALVWLFLRPALVSDRGDQAQSSDPDHVLKSRANAALL